MTLSGPTELAHNPARLTARLTKTRLFVRPSVVATSCVQPVLSVSFPSSRVQPWCEAQPLARCIKPSGRHLAERG